MEICSPFIFQLVIKNNLRYMTEKNIKVLLADDHLLIRDGLTFMLNSFDGYTVCGFAGSGLEVVNHLKSDLKPDLILMDIQMPLMDGVETTRWVKTNHPHIKIIALTMFEDQNHVLSMLRAGADGFMAKDSSPEELHCALNAAMCGEFYYNEVVSTVMHKCLVNEHEMEMNHRRLSDRHTPPRGMRRLPPLGARSPKRFCRSTPAFRMSPRSSCGTSASAGSCRQQRSPAPKKPACSTTFRNFNRLPR